MGSAPGNPNPWTPYNTYRDCSLGICSIYCPQWCYIVFPPPPPDDSEDDSGTYFSPLVIAVIGILASAFLLVTYYTLATKYCRRRRGQHQGDQDRASDGALIGTVDHETNRQINGGGRATGLDESIIKSISVYKYQKGEGLVDGTDCSVCLSEFEENESLRLLPKCNHAFHVPCIDKWLKSHSSCPLCRSNIASLGDLPPAQPSQVAPYQPVPTAAVVNVSSHAYCQRPRTDAPVLVIQDNQRLSVQEEAVISLFCDGGISAAPKAPSRGNSQGPRPVESHWIGQESPQGIIRRSVSLNSSICGQGGASTSDHQVQIENGQVRFSIGIGSSGLPNGIELNDTIGTNNFVAASPPEMKRSISTGRFILGTCGRGMTWVLPS